MRPSFPPPHCRYFREFGQQISFLLNHHCGTNAIFDVILNGSLVQSDCQTPEGCSYGGQQLLALSYQLQERTRLYVEAFGQNSESNTPPGIYCMVGFYRQFGESFGLDGGLRFGLTERSPRIGVTVGVVLGRHLSNGLQPVALPSSGHKRMFSGLTGSGHD
jgi:hypothetical protein